MNDETTGSWVGVVLGLVGVVLFLVGFFAAPAWAQLILLGYAMLKNANQLDKFYAALKQGK